MAGPLPNVFHLHKTGPACGALQILFLASACFSPTFSEGVPCAVEMQCPRGQVCAADNRCYSPDNIPDLADGGVTDAKTDASIDAQPLRYELVYVSEYRLNVDSTLTGLLVIANPTEEPVLANTLSLVSVEDDHPTLTVNASVGISNAEIGLGEAGGELTSEHALLIETDGLLPETRVDTNTNYLSVQIPNLVPSDDVFDINVELTLEIEGIRTVAPMVIRHPQGMVIQGSAQAAARIPSNFLP